MNKFWDFIDISENLKRTVRVVRRADNGIPAFCMAALSFMMFCCVVAAAYVFDIRATIGATEGFVDYVSANLPDGLAQYAVMFVLAITVAPTAFEMGGAAFAKEGSTPYQGVVIALSLFDMVTDAPGVTAFLVPHWVFFEQFGIFAKPVFALAWVLWLFCASFGFEMLVICTFIATLGFLLKGFSKSTN